MADPRLRIALVTAAQRRFADCMLADYLADKPARDRAFPIVE